MCNWSFTIWGIRKMQLIDKPDILGSALFSNLTIDELNKIFVDAYEKNLKAGETFIKEKESNSSLYVLLEGKVEITKKYKHGDGYYSLATFNKSGEIIGELSILGGISSASAKALIPTKLLVIPYSKMDNLAQKDLNLYLKFTHRVIETITKRIKGMNEKIVASLELELRKKERELKIADFLAYLAFGLLTIIVVIDIILRFHLY